MYLTTCNYHMHQHVFYHMHAPLPHTPTCIYHMHQHVSYHMHQHVFYHMYLTTCTNMYLTTCTNMYLTTCILPHAPTCILLHALTCIYQVYHMHQHVSIDMDMYLSHVYHICVHQTCTVCTNNMHQTCTTRDTSVPPGVPQTPRSPTHAGPNSSSCTPQLCSTQTQPQSC